MARRIDYKVQGLDCAEEVAILRREVGGLPGVLDLEFDVINARMSVHYDPEAIEPERFVQAIDATGMKATPWKKRLDSEPTSFWSRRGRLVMACLSGGLLLSGFISHWIVHGSIVHAFAGGHADEHVFPLVSLLLYAASAVAGASYVLPKAVHAVRRLRPDMNLLMTIAVLGAMILGEWFEAGTVAFLFAVALLLEHWSVDRARRAIGALLDLSPQTARYIRPEQGEIHEEPPEDVPVGATVLVRPGERIPLDGVVTKGESSVNQAPITGESMPVSKVAGDAVYAGTINEDGALEFEATRAAADTTLARIIHMVEQAQSRRANSQQWVDRFSLYYTPAMMFLAVGLAVLPPLLLGLSWSEWTYRGLVILVIACPCALVISTPVSVVSALASSARQGVLIKGGVYLEAAGRLRALAMDKTGTLTHGRPEVQHIFPLNGHTEAELLQRAAALEAASEHPLARAVLRKAKERNIVFEPAQNFQAHKGKGGEAAIEGRTFWVGSHRFMHEKGQESDKAHARALELEDAGHTVVAIGNETHVCGLISIADAMRPNVTETIQAIKQAGIEHVLMLTGDNEGTARAIADAASIDEFRSELLPEDKVEAVATLAGQYGHVAMVGDGVNDAPAMAAATFGIAMGAMGTDAALETADVALMSDDLGKLPWLIGHSRRTLRVIKQNISFALGLKLLFIILTLLGVASLWMAIAADTGATLLVVLNSLRLLRPD
ncbi:MAG: heavy metal translocating P-type ATPase [Planctomycetota bacterium]